MVIEQVDIHTHKNKSRHGQKLIQKDLNKIQNTETLRIEHRSKYRQPWVWWCLSLDIRANVKSMKKKKRIDKLDFTEIQIFCPVKRMKRKATDVGELLAKNILLIRDC